MYTKYGKKALDKAFSSLRQQGYFAAQDYWCCGTCAWCSLTEEQAERAVFYHEQSAEDLRETGSCYLSWSGDGDRIVSTLTRFGIHASWNGSPSIAIHITLPQPPK